MEIREEVQTCRFTPVSENISLYSGAHPGRRLLFAFAGRGVGMFMPTALALQYFVPEGCDVVALHDPARVGFISGIFGYADSFSDVIEQLRKDIDLGAYESIGVYGISSGGAAALAAGVLLGAPTASCFSGHMPMASKRRSERPGADTMEALLREAAPLSGILLCVRCGEPVRRRSCKGVWRGPPDSPYPDRRRFEPQCHLGAAHAEATPDSLPRCRTYLEPSPSFCAPR